MSEPLLTGGAAFSRFELETLERVKALSALHPPAQRPGIRAAVQLLLDHPTDLPPEGVAFTLGPRTLRLLPRRVFMSNGDVTAGVELLALRDESKDAVIARLIRKRIQRPVLDVANTEWLSEVLFYLEVAPQLACEGMRVPVIYGCHADDGGVTLVMEFFGRDPAELPTADRLRKYAYTIGRLGAFSHVHALYERAWIERVTPRLNAEALLALEHLIRGSLPDAEGERCISVLENFINDPQLRHTLSESGIACIAHGDFHPWNVFPMAGGDVGVIDWSYVGRGMIGEDLARLMLPHFLSHPIWADRIDFPASVSMMSEEVIAGAKSILPSLDEDKVRIAIARVLLLAVGNVAGQNPEGLKQRLSGGDEKLLVKLQSIFRYAAETARQLEARFGG